MVRPPGTGDVLLRLSAAAQPLVLGAGSLPDRSHTVTGHGFWNGPTGDLSGNICGGGRRGPESEGGEEATVTVLAMFLLIIGALLILLGTIVVAVGVIVIFMGIALIAIAAFLLIRKLLRHQEQEG
jgi:hypothetical protein